MFALQETNALFDSDVLLNGLRVAGIIIAAYVAVLWLAAVLWTYRDIQSRSISRLVQLGATALVAAFNLPGLLLYLAARPQEPLVESYNRQLEAEAFMREIGREDVPGRRTIDDGFLACPYCRATLQTPCYDCHRNLKSYWVVCPYCGTERDRPAAASVATWSPAQAASAPAPLRARENGTRAAATRTVS
jgi:hypothetical protein